MIVVPSPTPMPRPVFPDPTDLATLARLRDREIRPTLLRLQARAFADAPSRDRRMCETFATLACGLAPLVSDTTLAEIAAILASVPETPPALLRLIEERLAAPVPVRAARDPMLGRSDVVDLLATDRRDVDRALAENRSAPLDAHAVAILVERARADGELARLLLVRPEPGQLDRAALYCHADRPQREAIRLGLARAAAVATPALKRPTKAARTRILKVCAGADWAGLLATIGRALAIAPEPDWPRDREAGRELVALCLALLGLDGGERIAAIAAVAPALEPDEPARLAMLGATPVACAALLVGAGTAPKSTRRPASETATRRGEAEDQRVRRTITVRPARAAAEPGPTGRRSRSTRGRDRT